jgi:hypothetical protein
MDRSFVFRIVIAYEDFDTGTRATMMTKRLAAQLPPEIGLATDAWKFELIGDPHLCELARKSATDANMLIISVTGNSELPADISEWLENWALRERNQPVALVALHNLEPQALDESPPLRTYLRRVAEQGNMHFFWYGEDRPAKNVSSLEATLGGAVGRDQLAEVY